MVDLSEEMVMKRTKQSSLSNIINLNMWACDIHNVTILPQLRNLEVLSLSMNHIEHLKDFSSCDKLRELYLRKNKIESLKELEHLKGLTNLRVLWLSDNPCAEDPNYFKTVQKELTQVTKLDNIQLAKAIQVNDQQQTRAALDGTGYRHKEGKHDTYPRNQVHEGMVKMQESLHLQSCSLFPLDNRRQVSCPAKNIQGAVNLLLDEMESRGDFEGIRLVYQSCQERMGLKGAHN